MTSIISPIVIMIEIIVLMTIFIVILLRLYSDRFSETSTLLRLAFLSILATDTGASLYLITFYLVNMPYLIGSVLGMLLLAFGVSFCIGFLAPVDKKRAQDDVWTRWFKERNEGLEKQRKSKLADEEHLS